MSCMRDGKVCTKCCEVIHVTVKKRDFLTKYRGYSEETDIGFIVGNWKPLSKRRAKKKNPWMFKQLGKKHNMTFWKCKNVSEKGCKIHERRPKVCSGYPWYGGEINQSSACTYTPSCAVYYNIPVVVL